MNRSISVLAALAVLFSVNCSDNSGSRETLIADSQMELKVEGMVCAVGCAKYIEKELTKMPGVASCEVNFESGIAVVSYSGESVQKEEILEKIGSLADGQYKASVIGNKSNEKKQSGSGTSVSKTDSEPKVSFRIPELVTYFMHRLIR